MLLQGAQALPRPLPETGEGGGEGLLARGEEEGVIEEEAVEQPLRLLAEEGEVLVIDRAAALRDAAEQRGVGEALLGRLDGRLAPLDLSEGLCDDGGDGAVAEEAAGPARHRRGVEREARRRPLPLAEEVEESHRERQKGTGYLWFMIPSGEINPRREAAG